MSNLHHFRCEAALWDDFASVCARLGQSSSAVIRRNMREIAYGDSIGEEKHAEE